MPAPCSGSTLAACHRRAWARRWCGCCGRFLAAGQVLCPPLDAAVAALLIEWDPEVAELLGLIPSGRPR